MCVCVWGGVFVVVAAVVVLLTILSHKNKYFVLNVPLSCNSVCIYGCNNDLLPVIIFLEFREK